MARDELAFTPGFHRAPFACYWLVPVSEKRAAHPSDVARPVRHQVFPNATEPSMASSAHRRCSCWVAGHADCSGPRGSQLLLILSLGGLSTLAQCGEPCQEPMPRTHAKVRRRSHSLQRLRSQAEPAEPGQQSGLVERVSRDSPWTCIHRGRLCRCHRLRQIARGLLRDLPPLRCLPDWPPPP